MYDIVIIGAGTAGLSASIYASRASKSVLLLEEKMCGGQIINTPEVENYPGIKNISGFEFATNLYDQAVSLGAVMEYEKAVKIIDKGDTKIVVTDKREIECRAVIIATGAKNRPLGVERETELIGMGVSYCATCDGAFFRNKDVCVVGGGNTALEDANFLSNYCSKVYVIHRREGFRGEDKLLNALKEKANIEFVLNSVVTKLNGEDKVSSIIVKNVKDEIYKEIDVSAVFIAIGQMPDNKDFESLVELDKTGYVVADESCLTKTKGIFTAGDCRTKTVRQLTTAAADGAVSALAACEYLFN